MIFRAQARTLCDTKVPHSVQGEWGFEIRAASVMPEKVNRPSVTELPRWERWSVLLLLTVFAVFQANGIHNEAYIGQDYLFHLANTKDFIAEPSFWVAQDDTSRPLLYWLGGLGHVLTGGRWTYEAVACLTTALAVAALGFLHAGSRRGVADPRLRVAALALIAFVPVTQVTAVVYAADALTLLPFAAACWSLARSVEAEDSRAALTYGLGAGAALVLGNLAKLTFAFLCPALIAVLLLLVWVRRLSARRAALIGLASVALPLVVAIAAQSLNRLTLAGDHPRHQLNWHGAGDMTWRSLLGLKSSDARIFAAPPYWATPVVAGKTVVPMLENNGYSYPALLHLGIFTDVLDILDREGFQRLKPRPESHARLARWAVRSGVIFSVATLVALFAYAGESLRQLRRRAAELNPALLIWAVFSAAWFLPLVLTLPFVTAAYTWGYWLPLLVVPALWGFGLILYAMLDRWIGGRGLAWGVLAATLLQSVLEIASGWY